MVFDEKLKVVQGVGFNKYGDYFGQVYKKKQHGIGRYCFYVNWIYEGEWKDGWKHGFGRMIDKDGNYYIGHYDMGYMHGPGKHVQADGVVREGMWSKNTFIGRFE